ncbi:hypothetical protein BWI97_01595 [Siphonobacter sp. BAB-5405]|uniref:T9SS type A sorting domain-containing protein n=1 Tax=Siphonobacter sp. BAB-5405 TaxID=1864825 RepID=UPI000C7FF3B4|nr:T9SS type A sorting domain-containing protein [Siphonobacter sp. BAB-5405]PMD99127.1 hypothetical protein BWI97_01595 [Siphonobacter sp. BAB-5405]
MYIPLSLLINQKMKRIVFPRGILFYVWVYLLVVGNVSVLSAQRVQKQPDHTGEFKPVEPITKKNPIHKSTSASMQMVIVPDTARPSTHATVIVSLGPDVALKNGSVFLFVKKDIGIYLNSKAIDPVSRTIRIPVAGLRADTEYTFSCGFQNNCMGDLPITMPYKTPAASRHVQKVLLILDEEYQGDPQIKEAVARYQQDALRANGRLVFEEFYLSKNPVEKEVLYEKIKKDFYSKTAPLEYLFFIGQNANAKFVTELYDPTTNQRTLADSGYSLSIYTKVTAQDYLYDRQREGFVNRRYTCGDGPAIQNRLTSSIDYSYMCDLSFGALVPTREEEGKSYILNYFNKLHRFKQGEIKFDRRVLSADTFYDDSKLSEQLAELNARWKEVDTVAVSHVKDVNYHGEDLTWIRSYNQKLTKKSYELVLLQGHGSETYHYLGINANSVRSYEQLNSMMFFFFSCRVAGVQVRDYLAGTYLNTGNTLFVNAYSVNLFQIGEANQSVFPRLFQPGEVFNRLSKGEYVSDAIRTTNSYISSLYLLGDPLLQLDPPVVTALENPEQEALWASPNPTNGSFYVKWPQTWETAHLDIFDPVGRRVHQQSFVRQHSERLTLSLARGLYILKVSQGSQTLSTRIYIH